MNTYRRLITIVVLGLVVVVSAVCVFFSWQYYTAVTLSLENASLQQNIIIPSIPADTINELYTHIQDTPEFSEVPTDIVDVQEQGVSEERSSPSLFSIPREPYVAPQQ